MTYHITTMQMTLIGVLAVWDLVWRGIALWQAGKNRQLTWFIVLLVINSVGVIPIIYLLLNKDRPSMGSGQAPAQEA